MRAVFLLSLFFFTVLSISAMLFKYAEFWNSDFRFSPQLFTDESLRFEQKDDWTVFPFFVCYFRKHKKDSTLELHKINCEKTSISTKRLHVIYFKSKWSNYEKVNCYWIIYFYFLLPVYGTKSIILDKILKMEILIDLHFL